MYNEIRIMKLTNIKDYKLSMELQESLKDIEWRFKADNFLEVFAEVEGKTIIGIGISWLNSFHPQAKYIRIASINNFDLFMRKLLHTITPQNHIIYSCWDEDSIKINYLTNWNFKLFRKTYMVTRKVNELLNTLVAPSSTATLLSLEEILNQPQLEKELFTLVKENYEQTHLHNPVRNMTWQLWKETLLEDLPDLQYSFIAVENDLVVGYVFLHPISDTLYDVGWLGSSTDFDLHVILKEQLHKLKNEGVLEVEFEVDTTDHHALVFSRLLTLHDKKSWNSYIYIP